MNRYRYEFSELETWRRALPYAPLLICNDPENGVMDAPEYLPAGSTDWKVIIARGTGPHEYGPVSTICRRVSTK